MSTNAKFSPPSEGDAMALAHKRMEEMFRNRGSRVTAEVQRELSSGVDAIIGEILSLHFLFVAKRVRETLKTRTVTK